MLSANGVLFLIIVLILALISAGPYLVSQFKSYLLESKRITINKSIEQERLEQERLRTELLRQQVQNEQLREPNK